MIERTTRNNNFTLNHNYCRNSDSRINSTVVSFCGETQTKELESEIMDTISQYPELMTAMKMYNEDKSYEKVMLDSYFHALSKLWRDG